jgi:deoxyribose-phosphate aldolase
MTGMKYSYAELAGMIDHALLHPTLSDAELRAGCTLAAKLCVASVCIKPYAVTLAAAILRGSDVAVGTVIGFPHGGNATEIKRMETARACADGATEIDMVINIGKAMSGDWRYVEEEIRAICHEAHTQTALVKVIFENDFFAGDATKIQLCEISESAGADFVKTSTGFGFVKAPDGRFNTSGATLHDVTLMRANVSSKVQVKAAGGVRDLATLIAMRDLGVTRCGTSASAAILDEYQRSAREEKTGQLLEAGLREGTGEAY